MNLIGKLLHNLRKQSGLTQKEVAKALDVEQAAVSQMESGKIGINADKRNKLAALFHVPLDVFEKNANQMSRGDLVRVAGESGIPVINRAPAGQVVDYEEHGVTSGHGYEYLDWGSVRDDLAFAVIVKGDSMEPSLYDGDQVILSWCNPYELRSSGTQPYEKCVVFARFTPESGRDGCTLARFYKLSDDQIRLAKDNGRYAGLTVNREDISQLAVVIERRTTKI